MKEIANIFRELEDLDIKCDIKFTFSDKIKYTCLGCIVKGGYKDMIFGISENKIDIFWDTFYVVKPSFEEAEFLFRKISELDTLLHNKYNEI